MNKQRRMTRARRLRPIAQIGSVSSGTMRDPIEIIVRTGTIRGVRVG